MAAAGLRRDTVQGSQKSRAALNILWKQGAPCACSSGFGCLFADARGWPGLAWATRAQRPVITWMGAHEWASRAPEPSPPRSSAPCAAGGRALQASAAGSGTLGPRHPPSARLLNSGGEMWLWRWAMRLLPLPVRRPGLPSQHPVVHADPCWNPCPVVHEHRWRYGTWVGPGEGRSWPVRWLEGCMIKPALTACKTQMGQPSVPRSTHPRS